jgi:hypothetical protein
MDALAHLCLMIDDHRWNACHVTQGLYTLGTSTSQVESPQQPSPASFSLYTYPYFPFTRWRHIVFSMCDTFSNSTMLQFLS